MSKTPTFEQAVKRLEEIVRLLESGEKALDESMALFEEGTKLSAFCEQQLSTAEQRIQQLSEIPEPVPAPAEPGDDGDIPF